MGGGGGRVEMQQCLFTDGIVIPLVTFLSFAKIQVLYLFANSIALAGWVCYSLRVAV